MSRERDRPFDVCVVGHVTRDLVRTGSGDTAQPGGTAYYAALALRALGAAVAVVTRVSSRDADELLGELQRRDVTVLWRDSAASSAFENDYTGPRVDDRAQRILSVADAFGAADVPAITARAVHLGPLTAADMDASFAAALLARAGAEDALVSLDVQGLVRRPAQGDAKPLLRLAHIVKADTAEAEALTGRVGMEACAKRLLELGPREVLITRGGRGSVVFTARGRLPIAPVAAPGPVVDRTGCGDTYAAAYLLARLRGRDPAASGRFASAIAAAKLTRRGGLASVPGQYD